MDVLGAEDVHRLLDYPSLIAALDEAHRQAPPVTSRVFLEAADENRPAGEGFLVLPAWSTGRNFGTKLVTLLPDNAVKQNGYPTVQAIYPYFDGETGAPKAVIDGTALTLRKTAADSALASSMLSRSDAETLLMVGAGALAPHLIAAHLAARPSIEKVMVWNRTPERRDSVVAALSDHLAIAAAADLEGAVREADVISAATMTTEPLVSGAWLKPGTHVDLVGGFTPEMRESDDEAVLRASVFVDSFETTVGVAGDIVQPMTAGVLAKADIRSDLYGLCRGDHPGRIEADEITLYKNGGGAHLDLFTARHLVKRFDAERA